MKLIQIIICLGTLMMGSAYANEQVTMKTKDACHAHFDPLGQGWKCDGGCECSYDYKPDGKGGFSYNVSQQCVNMDGANCCPATPLSNLPKSGSPAGNLKHICKK
jgi:hypothetical protein